MDMTDGLVGTLRASYQKIGSPSSILLAFSGGADSMALLHGLASLQEEMGFALHLTHVNHGLRASSAEEEVFVQAVASRMGLPVQVARVDVRREGNLEAAAREARYGAFRAARAECGAAVIALAHHADDQAETLLMHLLRGSGLAGLAGMPEWNAPYWRPLLLVPKSVLVSVLQENNLDWVEDESNQDTSFTRNYLRARVLPHLERLQPGAACRMSQTAAMLRDEAEWHKELEDAWLTRFSKFEPPFHYLMLDRLRGEHTAFRRSLLRAACARMGLALDFEQTEALNKLLTKPPGSRMNLPRGMCAYLSKERLHILPDAVNLSHVRWPQPIVAPYEGKVGDGRHAQAMNPQAIKGARMRQALPGDTISLLGMDGSQPLRKLLSARGVDQPFRRFWPVFAQGSRVLWAPGLGVSRDAALGKDTRGAVTLVYEVLLPDEMMFDGGGHGED